MFHSKAPKFSQLTSWPTAELSPVAALQFWKRSAESLPKQRCSIHQRQTFPECRIFSFTTPHSMSAIQTSDRIIETCHGTRWHHHVPNTSPEMPAETSRDEEGLKAYTQAHPRAQINKRQRKAEPLTPACKAMHVRSSLFKQRKRRTSYYQNKTADAYALFKYWTKFEVLLGNLEHHHLLSLSSLCS